MALIQRAPSRKKQVQQILALAAVVLVTATVAYIGLFRKPKPAAPSSSSVTAGVPSASNSIQQSGIEALLDLSDTSSFRELKKFGNWPLPVEPRGKTEPFIEPEVR